MGIRQFPKKIVDINKYLFSKNKNKSKNIIIFCQKFHETLHLNKNRVVRSQFFVDLIK